MVSDRAAAPTSPALHHGQAERPNATAADQVYERLRSLIVTGELAPGTPLDQQRLAELLEVSRMPLRQALVRLSEDGLVETKARSSARVAALSRREAKELYALRAAIEPVVARNACLSLTESDLAHLRALNKEISMAVKFRQYSTFVVHDRKFHRDFYACSSYVRAQSYVERLRDASDRYVLAYAAHSANSSTSVQEHEEILRACERRDVEEVGEMISAHVERGAKVLLELID